MRQPTKKIVLSIRTAYGGLEHDTIKNLKDYYCSVGFERFADSGETTSENAETPRQHVGLGKIKHLINKIDETKACGSKDFPAWLTKEAK